MFACIVKYKIPWTHSSQILEWIYILQLWSFFYGNYFKVLNCQVSAITLIYGKTLLRENIKLLIQINLIIIICRIHMTKSCFLKKLWASSLMHIIIFDQAPVYIILQWCHNDLASWIGVGVAVRFLVVGTISKEERPPQGQLWMEQYLISLKYWPI